MLNILLFGPPGAGKGTQSKKVVENYRLLHISTGDILRKEISEHTPLGKVAQHYIDKGELVPDNVVIGMIEEIYNQNKNVKGYVFDGFPRTVAQATALDEMLAKKKQTINLMIVLEAPENELIKRLTNRAKIEGRKDDDLQIIENRIKVYTTQTEPVIEHYHKQGKVHKVNGLQTIEAVFEDICQIIDNFLKNND